MRVMVSTLVGMLCWCLLGPMAHADCPSSAGCNMARDVAAILEPDEACIDVRTGDDSCECSSWVSLENNCAVSLQAQDFTFGECRIDGEVMKTNCPDIIPPGSWGSVFLPVDPLAEPGPHDDELALSLSGNDISLKIHYRLVRLESGCGCSSSRGSGLTFLGFLVLLGLSRRRMSPFSR